MNIKNTLRQLKQLFTGNPLFQPNLCFGQDGEDLILDRLLQRQEQGFYVDIGAHHPVRFSNTYLFYQRGWRGLNVDAMPGSMELFQRIRPNDINIECGVAGAKGELTYYCFNEPALNTFEQAEAELKNKHPYALLETKQVHVERLDALLDRYLPQGQAIDFLSVDVEGKDEEVLLSNDWTRFRPRFILAETLRTENLLDLKACPVVQLLATVGYIPVGKAYNTSFFMREGE